MKEKYDVKDPTFDRKHGVLKNKLGITNEKGLILEEAKGLAHKKATYTKLVKVLETLIPSKL